MNYIVGPYVGITTTAQLGITNGNELKVQSLGHDKNEKFDCCDSALRDTLK